jgi:hypothetical protein
VRKRENTINVTIYELKLVMSDVGKEEKTFVCDRCGMSFTSENQMNAHKVSSHAVAGGEITNR